MKAFIKSTAVKLLTGNYTRIKMVLMAGAAAGVTKLITRFGLDIGPDWSAQISMYAGLAAAWFLTEIARWLGVSGIQELQNIMPDPAVAATGQVSDAMKGGLKELVNAAHGAVVAPLTMAEDVALHEARMDVEAKDLREESLTNPAKIVLTK